MLLLLLLCLAGSQVVPPSHQLNQDINTFEGFIYPYVVSSRHSTLNQLELIFERLDQSRFLFRPEDAPNLLEQNYQLLPLYFSYSIENVGAYQLDMGQSVIVFADRVNPNRASMVLMRNPHLYLHLEKTASNGELKHFIGMFDRHDEYAANLPNHELRLDNALLAVEELWREYIYVYLFRQEGYFTIFLKRHIIHSSNYVEPYRFARKFYFDEEILGMKLIKSSLRDVLSVVLFDANRFCMFSTRKDLELVFQYCKEESQIGVGSGLMGYPYDAFVFLRKTVVQPIPQVIDQKNPETSSNPKIQNKIVVYHLQRPQEPACTYLEQEQIMYIAMTDRFTIYCAAKFCKLMDSDCVVVGQHQLQKAAALSIYEKHISNIQLIRYNITADQYISQLIIQTTNYTFRQCFCLYGEIPFEVNVVNNKSQWTCKTVAPAVVAVEEPLQGGCPKGEYQEEVKDRKGKLQFVCRKNKEGVIAATILPSAPRSKQVLSVIDINNSTVPQPKNKCVDLNCFECSMTSHCYFINQECQLIVGRLPQLHSIDVYQQANQFEQMYSRYLYGQTSSCSDDTLYCTYNKSSIVSTVRMVKYRNPPVAGQYCTIFVPLDVDSRYRFRYSTTDHNFNVSLCENGLHDSPFGCFERNTSVLTHFEIRGIRYMMLYFFYYGNLTTLQDGLHQLQGQNLLQEDYELINIEEEEIYNATRLFTIVFGSFLLITILFIAYILLKNRLMARLALWGFVAFVPSGVYPLSSVELRLKVRELIKKGFIQQYKYELKQNGKEESRTSEDCSFCLEQFQREDSIFEIYCRHKYHKVCLSDWIGKERNSRNCPICKRGFTQGELVRFNQGNYSYGFSQEVAINN